MVVALPGLLQSLVRGRDLDCKCIVAAIVQLEVKRYIVFNMCAYDILVAAVVEVYGNRRQQCFAALSPSCSAVPVKMDAN